MVGGLVMIEVDVEIHTREQIVEHSKPDPRERSKLSGRSVS